jgi:hypothetical protein
MQPGEIAIEYKQAKNKLKQVSILAELNQCSKAEIIRILQEQGVQVDGRLLQAGKKKPAPQPTVDPDPVDHPEHYTRGGIECIDAITAAVCELPGTEAWLVGQVIKYVWRYKWKNGLEDLSKARFYLDRLIAEIQ